MSVGDATIDVTDAAELETILRESGQVDFEETWLVNEDGPRLCLLRNGAVEVPTGTGAAPATRDAARRSWPRRSFSFGIPACLTIIGRRPDEPRRLTGSIQRLCNEVGWRPADDLTAGLTETIDWLAANRPSESLDPGQHPTRSDEQTTLHLPIQPPPESS